MSTEFDEAYTTALALNNVGVSLLRRQCYQPAKHAFHSALQAIREVSSSVLQDGQYISSPHFEAVLQSSYTHLSQSAVADDAKIRVITEEESANVISSFVQEPNFLDSSTNFLIRIECEGKSIQDCRNRDMVMESSIIMYNYGMLYKCIASTEATTEITLQRVKKASELFRLAFGVLQNPCQDYYGVLEMLAFSILVLCCLADCAFLLGLETEEKEYHLKMIELREYLSEEQYRLGTVMNDATAAAA